MTETWKAVCDTCHEVVAEWHTITWVEAAGRLHLKKGNCESVTTVLTREMEGWAVTLDAKEIDKVHCVKGMSAEEVKKSLVKYDGYDPMIEVKKEALGRKK